METYDLGVLDDDGPIVERTDRTGTSTSKLRSSKKAKKRSKKKLSEEDDMEADSVLASLLEDDNGQKHRVIDLTVLDDNEANRRRSPDTVRRPSNASAASAVEHSRTDRTDKSNANSFEQHSVTAAEHDARSDNDRTRNLSIRLLHRTANSASTNPFDADSAQESRSPITSATVRSVTSLEPSTDATDVSVDMATCLEQTNICEDNLPSLDRLSGALDSAVSAGSRLVSKMIRHGTEGSDTSDTDEDAVEMHLSETASQRPTVKYVPLSEKPVASKNRDRMVSSFGDGTNDTDSVDSSTGLVEFDDRSVDDEMGNTHRTIDATSGAAIAKDDRTKADRTRNDDADDEEEDVVESTKRLLMMADKRLQYQQHSDEVKKLKEQIRTMKEQTAALTEQLRRAVETKCDLVVAQTEMERIHEMQIMAKDDEIMLLKRTNKNNADVTAKLELKFMNDMNLLSERINDMDRRHRNEILEKDYHIAQLEQKVTKLKTESVRRASPRRNFRSRFLDSPKSLDRTTLPASLPGSPNSTGTQMGDSV